MRNSQNRTFTPRLQANPPTEAGKAAASDSTLACEDTFGIGVKTVHALQRNRAPANACADDIVLLAL